MSSDLDRAVAEVVMGWTIVDVGDDYVLMEDWDESCPAYVDDCWCDSDVEFASPYNAFKKRHGHYPDCLRFVPQFSEDVTAAHAVIARMAELGWWCEAFYEGTSPDWRVIFGNEKNIMLDSVGPFPLAVCKAALAALEAK